MRAPPESKVAPFAHLFETETDAAIAALSGVSEARVGYYRRKHAGKRARGRPRRASAAVDALLEREGCKLDKDLAAKLGIAQATLSLRRKRDALEVMDAAGAVKAALASLGYLYLQWKEDEDQGKEDEDFPKELLNAFELLSELRGYTWPLSPGALAAARERVQEKKA